MRDELPMVGLQIMIASTVRRIRSITMLLRMSGKLRIA
jgi:hypothetical protein